MKKAPAIRRHHKAFTLTETVIAIGVLAVLLTGFIAVFTPAAQGIRRSISSEQADRLTTTLEMELVTLRDSQKTEKLSTATTGFAKAFEWIKAGGDDSKNAIFVYQYRGNPASIRADGTPKPVIKIDDKQPGKGYIVQSMARRIGEIEDGKDLLEEDLKAIEGSVFFVKPTQLVFDGGELILGAPGQIKNADGSESENTDAKPYTEAVIAFSAEFHSVPTKTMAYLESEEGFGKRFTNAKRPVFTRNLAVRR